MKTYEEAVRMKSATMHGSMNLSVENRIFV